MNVSVLDQQAALEHRYDFPAARGNEKRNFSISFAAAAGLHALLLFFGGMAFVRPAEYGIDLGAGGLEVYLVAAPAKRALTASPLGASVQEKKSEIDKNPETEMAFTEKGETRTAEQESSVLAAKNHSRLGDGSSPAAGEDFTTVYSPGGAWIDAKASHLRNPAPDYPPLAIERGEEGLVVISALVNQEGRPSRVAVKQTSGFSLLDQSAASAIKKWKFNPARLGFFVRETWVTIPVRFRLKDVE